MRRLAHYIATTLYCDKHFIATTFLSQYSVLDQGTSRFLAQGGGGAFLSQGGASDFYK